MSAVEGTVEEAGEEQVTAEQPEKGAKESRPAKGNPLRRIALGAGRLSPVTRLLVVVVLALLVIASGVVAGWKASQEANAKAVQADRQAAAAAAKTEIPQILTYSYKSLSQDLAKGAADTTGQFKGQFSMEAQQIIEPQVPKEQIATRAQAPVAVPIDSSGNQVTVLVFLDQSTTSKAQPKAQVSQNELRVTMQKTGGKWLVEEYQAQ
ncbi:MAG: hypothetical protein FWE35_02745 [Streptosporangiales bacterium]|jgi:Mce-associated membrane protein|nr:hypothetical protein [Streptosporangiales bacterium]